MTDTPPLRYFSAFVDDKVRLGSPATPKSKLRANLEASGFNPKPYKPYSALGLLGRCRARAVQTSVQWVLAEKIKGAWREPSTPKTRASKGKPIPRSDLSMPETKRLCSRRPLKAPLKARLTRESRPATLVEGAKKLPWLKTPSRTGRQQDTQSPQQPLT